MNRKKQYYHSPKNKKTKFGRRPRVLKIRPGADAGLKKVFASIGVPDKKPFKPDPFQLEALSVIERTDCLVTVPTGAGKTWIAQQAMDRIHKKGGRSWYASPLKALSNTKYGEFSEIFGAENVGILTGDRKENYDAPVIVGTTEILRNQLYDSMHKGTTLLTDLVILDEAHFLGDEDRGVVWEEIMIYLPARIPLLLLSATIGNADIIAKWLSSIRSKKCIVVQETKRPVPLYPLFFHPSGMLLPLIDPKSPTKSRLHKKVFDYVDSKCPPVLALPHKLPPVGEIMTVFNKYRLLPAIFFLKSRADCDHALDLCADIPTLDENRKAKRSQRIQELVSQSPHIAGHRQLGHLEHLAVGSHHSGQLPAWKLVLETLMTEGLLDAVFATSTVAAGVNFPARTIVLLNSDRFNGRDFLPLSPTEFHQMTGRAGRRGMDHIGFAVAVPGKFMDIRRIGKLMTSLPSDVASQIKINFSMALNLLLSHTPEQIEDLLKKSFATYMIVKSRKKSQSRRSFRNERKQLWRDFLHHLNFLKDTGYVTEEGMLTADGIWASQLRVDQPLMIAQGFRLGIFPESDPALFAAVTTLFVNERESDDSIEKMFKPKTLLATFRKVKTSLEPFAKQMTDRGFDVRPLFLRPAATLYAWATGQSWEKVLSVAKMEEGDLAMLILRTADNLRHIRTLTRVFPEAAETSARSIELIMRYPVVIECDM
ncbi:MAG: ATP-dependent DNA helicase [Desulfobacteraceae bacterium 4572_187]|nr:MAG: ATP-dependent DNA helicase [Desulfobacteraceae bacterium 4572_187]RLB76644.1 MAG: ATP-dependent DNA helicase [Deltaproteobacteria bacterium]